MTQYSLSTDAPPATVLSEAQDLFFSPLTRLKQLKPTLSRETNLRKVWKWLPTEYQDADIAAALANETGIYKREAGSVIAIKVGDDNRISLWTAEFNRRWGMNVMSDVVKAYSNILAERLVVRGFHCEVTKDIS